MYTSQVSLIISILFWILPGLLFIMDFRKAKISAYWLLFLLIPGYIWMAAIYANKEAKRIKKSNYRNGTQNSLKLYSKPSNVTQKNAEEKDLLTITENDHESMADKRSLGVIKILWGCFGVLIGLGLYASINRFLNELGYDKLGDMLAPQVNILILLIISIFFGILCFIIASKAGE